MNKIYRTVYNETTGTWVAVEETAKSHRKSNGVVNETHPCTGSAPAREAGSLKKFSIAAAVAALVSPFVVSEANAETMNCFKPAGMGAGNIWVCNPDSTNATNKTSNNIVFHNASATTGKTYGMAWGKDSVISAINATAWGSGNAAGENSTAFGVGSKAP